MEEGGWENRCGENCGKGGLYPFSFPFAKLEGECLPCTLREVKELKDLNVFSDVGDKECVTGLRKQADSKEETRTHWEGLAFLLVAEETTQVSLGMRYGCGGRQPPKCRLPQGFYPRGCLERRRNSNKELAT